MAYADFVTAMMAFFLVMWITAQSKPVKQAVAEYFEDPLGTNDGARSTSIRGPEDATTIGHSASGMGPGRSLAMANLKSSAAPNPRGVSAIKPPRIVISRDGEHSRSIGTLIAFEGDSTTLDEQARERLALLVPLLLGKPNLIEVRGWVVDPTAPPNGDAAGDWDTTFGRCSSVMGHLIELGVPAQRLRLSQTGAREQLALLAEEGDTGGSGFPVEVFALSEYAAEFDESHDAQIESSKQRRHTK